MIGVGSFAALGFSASNFSLSFLSCSGSFASFAAFLSSPSSMFGLPTSGGLPGFFAFDFGTGFGPSPPSRWTIAEDTLPARTPGCGAIGVTTVRAAGATAFEAMCVEIMRAREARDAVEND